jgi:hypothetical protein
MSICANLYLCMCIYMKLSSIYVYIHFFLNYVYSYLFLCVYRSLEFLRLLDHSSGDIMADALPVGMYTYLYMSIYLLMYICMYICVYI